MIRVVFDIQFIYTGVQMFKITVQNFILFCFLQLPLELLNRVVKYAVYGFGFEYDEIDIRHLTLFGRGLNYVQYIKKFVKC